MATGDSILDDSSENDESLAKGVSNDVANLDTGYSSESEAIDAVKDLASGKRCSVTQEGDSLVIAVWKPANGEGMSDELKVMHEGVEYGPWSSDFRDVREITLVHARGHNQYCIPWSLTAKWNWIKEIIKLTYGSNEEAKKEIDEDKFTLSVGHGADAVILPELWTGTIKPWDIVTVTLASQDSGLIREADRLESLLMNKPVSQEEEETNSNDSVYQVKVKYRIDIFQKDRYSRADDFIQSKTYNDPVDLEKTRYRGKMIPVLEEINQIVIGAKKNIANGSRFRPDEIRFEDLLVNFNPEIDDKVNPKKLLIRSSLLLNAIRSIVKYSSMPAPDEENDSFSDGLFSFPFKDLYNHRQELLDFRNSTTEPRNNHTTEYNDECDEHIDVLVHYLDNEPTVQFMSIKERWERKIPTSTFAGLWALFKPGSDVYVKENSQLNAYVVDEVMGGIQYKPGFFVARKYSIRVWGLVFDGKTIKRKSKFIEVQVFDGEREVSSLPLFPTSFHDKIDGGILRRHLIDRGRKFLRLAKGPTFLEYTGTGLKQGTKKYNRARVVIEHQSMPWLNEEFRTLRTWHLGAVDSPGEMAPLPPRPASPQPFVRRSQNDTFGIGERARAPRCECFRCKTVDAPISTTFGNYDSLKADQEDLFTDHQALICMSHMFGFILKERTYDILDLNGLTEPKLAENAIDDLVLRPESNKITIKAIARTYTEVDSQSALFSVDFIRGKGEGQIFLLHGPPGTGKTLTAESIAEYTKRPLLSITAADLGHDPIVLERNLLRIFKNATAWDAIVLLDEADVYLEKRSINDLSRNSIVSIFLRALDYFQGILFFTTNRVGHFDEAFLSRIHVSIGYDPLDDKAREQIWQTFFKKLESSHKNNGTRIDYEYGAKQYVLRDPDVRQLQWNGREIRNAFQTAVALAIADARVARDRGVSEKDCIPEVTEAHLKQVVSLSGAFKKYILATHEGVNDADMAYRMGIRNDEAGGRSDA